jgi:urease accessory protein
MKASLNIHTAVRAGITYLKSSYYTPPFKVADITQGRHAGTLELMLMSASPGVLDGDDYTLNFHLEAGSLLRVQTQSYQRLFTMQGSATQHMEVHLEKNASLVYLPHPVVPHKGANFSVNSHINLSERCVLCWGEVVTCGRKLNGEIFQYTRYQNSTRISRCGKLVLKENLLLQPAIAPVNRMGNLEGYTHMASMICLDEHMPVKQMVQQASAWLALQPGMVGGISAAPVNGVTVRLLGYQAEQLYRCLHELAIMFQATKVATTLASFA